MLSVKSRRRSSDRKSSSVEKRRSSRKSGSQDLSSLTDSTAILDNIIGRRSLNSSSRRSHQRSLVLFTTDSQETNTEDDVEEELLEVEMEEIQKAQAAEKRHSSTKKEPVRKGKNVNLLINKLTPEELDNHYTQCIDLFSKNKVNMKNAFNLQLIDYMKFLVDKKTDKSENLTLMSCTLDASAKIYSCRVDNVYTNLIKFVNQGSSKTRKNREENQDELDKGSSDEESDMQNEKKKKKGRKKSKKPKSFTREVESFDRGEIEICYYRKNLPKHQTYFLEAPILEEGHELAPSRQPLFVNFIPTPESISATYCYEGSLPNDYEYKENFEEKICESYRDLRSRVFIMDDGPEEELQQTDNAFTYDPNLKSISEMKHFNDITDGSSECGEDDGGAVLDYDEVDMDVMENSVAINDISSIPVSLSSSRCSVPDSVGSTSTVSFTPMAMSRMLRSSSTSKHSDYSYFDDSKLEFMPSASHWKIKPSKRVSVTGTNKTPGRPRGKASFLDFSIDSIKTTVEGLLEEDGSSHNLAIKTTKDWFHKRGDLIYKPIIPNLTKLLLSLMKDINTCILTRKRSANNDIEECDAEKSIVLNPLDFTSMDDNSIEDRDNQIGQYHPDEDWSEKMDCGHQEEDEVHVTEGDTSDHQNSDNLQFSSTSNDLNSLVPAPTKVEKVRVNFAKSAKRIDIKKLKSAIWGIMDLDNPDSENKENEEEVSKKKKEVLYSEIYKEIPSRISKEAAAELSYPIAFMAILHMANEKCLRLKGNESHTDFTVTKD